MATVGWEAGRVKILTIAASSLETDLLNLGSMGTWASYRLGVLHPSALTGVLTVEVSAAEAGPFRKLQSNNTDITFIENRASVITAVPFRYLKFVSSNPEASERTIRLIAHLS